MTPSEQEILFFLARYGSMMTTSVGGGKYAFRPQAMTKLINAGTVQLVTIGGRAQYVLAPKDNEPRFPLIHQWVQALRDEGAVSRGRHHDSAQQCSQKATDLFALFSDEELGVITITADVLKKRYE